MQVGSSWHIGKDNSLIVNPYELRQLKGRRKLTDRTLHVECPQYDKVDQKTARAIAVLAMPDAAIGNCGYINVRGQRWHYEFKVKDLNRSIQKKWGRRTGMVQSPMEKQLAGCYYDTTRQLWQVPSSFGKRETIKFPTLGT